jgi:hypothetical protein
MNRYLAVGLALLATAAPICAKDNLGVFDAWAAFRDPAPGRCYAIAKAERRSGTSDYVAYASVGTWPKRAVRNQLHVRLSRKIAPTAAISLSVGGQRFRLSGGGGDAWAADKAMDAAIIAAMRSASSMSVSSVDARGRRFTDRYRLAGAATALDAASLGCARIRH